MLRFSKITRLSDSYEKIVIALGTFDGIHIGHQSILRRAQELAGDINGLSMAFTFQEHPLSILFPGRAPKKFVIRPRKKKSLKLLAWIF